eukprot:1386651-Rhodomonas_salina.6
MREVSTGDCARDHAQKVSAGHCRGHIGWAQISCASVRVLATLLKIHCGVRVDMRVSVAHVADAGLVTIGVSAS